MKNIITEIIESENKKSKIKYVVAGVVLTAGTLVAIKAYKKCREDLTNPEVVMPKLDAIYKQLMDDIQSYIERVEDDAPFEDQEEVIRYIESMAAKFNKCLIKVGNVVVEATDKYGILPTTISELEEYFYRTLGGTACNKN